MKLLLDENLPHRLRLELPGHEVYTAAYMRWAGVENGELLRLTAAAGFGALLTGDRGLEYQQNRGSLPLAVIVLLAKPSTIEGLRPLYSELLEVLSHLRPYEFVRLTIPR